MYGYTNERRSTRFSSAPGAPDVGIGNVYVLSPPADLSGVVDREAESADEEIQRFDAALQASRDEVRALSAKISGELRPEEMALFDFYLSMLDDNALGAEVRTSIRETNN